jgi:proteasome lid subunit RPN8/RPN11
MNLIIPQHVLLKLCAWRDMGATEVTGFFVTKKDEPLQVIDALLAKAKCSMATVDITQEAIAEMFMEQIPLGIYPEQLMIWWHTHPGNSAAPSMTDTETFEELSQDRTTNIMYILAKDNNEFARVKVSDLKTNITVNQELNVLHPVRSWDNIPSYAQLLEEYKAKVKIEVMSYAYTYRPRKKRAAYVPANDNAAAIAKQDSLGVYIENDMDEIGKNPYYDDILDGDNIAPYDDDWYFEDLFTDLMVQVKENELTLDDAKFMLSQEGFDDTRVADRLKQYDKDVKTFEQNKKVA